MKKIQILKILFLTIFLLLINITSVNAKEILKDGWHLVKSLNEESYDFGYYENGYEIMRKSRMIFVHRGWGERPENSINAFNRAKEAGYYAFETDVRFTKDNIPVLCHDGTINRVARDSNYNELSEPIYVKDSTLEELKKYRFVVTSGNVVKKDKKYADITITTFEEALIYAKNNRMTMMVELKAGTEEQIKNLVSMVKKYDMDNIIIWESFEPGLLEYVKKYDDDEIMIVPNDNLMTRNGATREEIYNLLKTDKNTVNVNGGGKKDKIFYSPGPDIPKKLDIYPADKYDITPLGLVQIKSLTIVKKPTKLIYIQNKEKLNLEDGKVKITYLDNTSKIVNMNDSSLTISQFNNAKLGKQKITINYADESVSFNVEVVEEIFKEEYALGDVNKDGKINSLDATLILKYVAKKKVLSEEQLKLADVTKDGKVNSLDAVKILKYVAKKITML